MYYPDGDSQLAWIRWTTPAEPQAMTITVRVRGGGSISNVTINVNIEDLNENPPPDPSADDRNDSFTRPSVPSKAQATSASWGCGGHGGIRTGCGIVVTMMDTGAIIADGSLILTVTPPVSLHQ